MDDEIRAALELTAEELARMERQGEPANVARHRPRDLNRMAASIVKDATTENQGVRLEPGGPRVTVIRLTERPGSDSRSFPVIRHSVETQTKEVTERS